MHKAQHQPNPSTRTGQTGRLQHHRLQGESVTRGSISVTPISQRISLGLPGWLGKDKGQVFIHQRPTALIVKRDDHAGSRTRTIPIHDLTHIILVFMFMLTAVCLYVILRPDRRN